MILKLKDKLQIAEAIAGGTIAGVGSLLSSGLGLIGTSMSNRTNREIARMNNKAMLQAMREQTASEQSYNSIGAQMARAQMAGLNPQTLANQGPTSASASGVPSLDSPVMQNPFAGFDTGLGQLGSAMITARQQQLQEEQIGVAEFESKVQMVKVLGDMAKDLNLTSDDVNNLVSSVFRGSDDQPRVASFMKDNLVKTRLNNLVQESNLSLDEKKYLSGWLDEMTNAQYMMLLADTENKQTSSNVNRSVERLNDAKKREVEQAIKNMEEQWKSLNFQGEFDANKLKHIASMTDSLVKQLSSDAHISKQEARFYIWSKINQTISSLPFSGGFNVIHKTNN